MCIRQDDRGRPCGGVSEIMRKCVTHDAHSVTPGVAPARYAWGGGDFTTLSARDHLLLILLSLLGENTKFKIRFY